MTGSPATRSTWHSPPTTPVSVRFGCTAASRPIRRLRPTCGASRALVATYADPGGTAPGAGPPGSWVRPVLHGPITSHFGQRWGRLHAGVDFGTPIGTPVYAASNGTVVAAGAAGGYGQWIKLGHAGGTTSVYGHVSSWTVAVGQPVAVGQLIGYSGNEGRSTGPHLHFEVRPDDRPVDPVAFYAAHGVELS